MKFFSVQESVKQAMQTVVSHKFRSALTVLGVIVGTTTTICVTSIISGMNARASEMMERFGSNVAFISKWSNQRFGPSSRDEEQRKPVTYDDAQAIAQLPHVAEATASLGVWPGEPDAPVIKYREREANRPVLRGGQASFFTVRSMNLDKGRFYTGAEDEHSVPVAVLGYDTAEALFPGIEPIDKEITIKGQVFRVVGVLEKSTARGIFGSQNWEDNCAIIPLGTFHKMYPQDKDYVVVARSTPGGLDAMVDEVTHLLRRRRNVKFLEEDNFGISTAQANVEGFNKVSSVLGMLIIPISGTGLLVGGIGVLNIMLVSVTERTKEIGVRRALGARKFDITLQFLIEAMSLTGFGGIIGILAGLGISAFVNAFVPALPSLVSTFWIVVGFVVAVGVGLVSGMWPALRAARLDPVEALRYE